MIEIPRSWSVALVAGCFVLAGCGAPENQAVGGDASAASPPDEMSASDTPLEESAPDSETADETLVQAWDCEDDSYVVTEFRPAKHEVVVFLPGETVLLPHVVSASGVKYSDGTRTVWTKGREMTLDAGDGESVSCSVNMRASNVESAKLAGYDLWAIGNEPGWQLVIGSPGIVWETDYGQTRREAEMPEPETDGEAARSVFRTETTEGQPLVITLEGGGCLDDMSGEAFETRVIIEFAEQTYRGCGQALH